MKEIKIDPTKYQRYHIVQTSGKFTHLNKINLLVGPNNSGKSRFLRTLFADDSLAFKLNKNDYDEVRSFLISSSNNIRQEFDKHGICCFIILRRGFRTKARFIF